MNNQDVTARMDFGNSDDEYLPIIKCVCGHEFDLWEFSISIYRDTPTVCPYCNRKFYFQSSVRIFEVE